ASGQSATSPLPARLDACRATMNRICSRLSDKLQRQQLKELIPLLKELYFSYTETARPFPDEVERNLACQALAESLVAAENGEVFRRLLLFMEAIIGRHATKGDLEAAPEDMTALSVLTRALHNFSDCSVLLVRALAASEVFCRDCCLRVFSNWTPLFLAGQLGTESGLCIRRLMDIVYNAYFKLDTETDACLSAYDFVEPVKPLLRSKDERISFSALLLVCFALDESKAEFYLGQKESISLLIRTLNRSIDSKNRRCLGYHTVELTKCVNRLALNDINKELLVELKILPVVHRLLDGGKPDEIGAAVNVLFTLSFNPAVQEQVHREFASQLTSLAGQSQWSNMASLKGLLFKLESTDSMTNHSARKASAVPKPKPKPGEAADASAVTENLATSTAAGNGFHVMISYQHESKETVARIRDQLKQHRIKVWIDYEQMKDGSTLEAMAEAVENSSIVLMCMSRKYKDSNNCRLEAEYAHRNSKKLIPLLMERGYKPTGWLGIILGAGLYHDFSGKYPFEAKFPELVAAVQKFLDLDSTDAALPAVQQQQQKTTAKSATKVESDGRYRREHDMPTPPSPQPLPPIGKSEKSVDVRAWTRADIEAWLAKRNDGAALIGWLRGRQLTGVTLAVLLDMRRRAPLAFYTAVEKHFDFGGFHLMAEFIDALEQL
ncbi:hypothetical protein BOX15_Mlig002835g1, partial [Macrostomum lignano]